MTEWTAMPAGMERITEASPPVMRLEHELRYRAAAPVVIGGDT